MQSRRNHYLMAMGIQVWQIKDASQTALPELNDNESLDWPEISSVPENSTSSTAALYVPLSEAKATAPSVQLNAEAEVFKADTEKSSPQQSDRMVLPEFRLASVVFPNVCIVVTQVPLQVSEPVSQQHLAYLKSLLQALGQMTLPAPQVTMFNWPMLRSANFDQSEGAALEACQAFLRAQKKQSNPDFVLLMGEKVGRYLLPDATSFEQDKGRLFERMGISLILTDSLAQIFSEPRRKAAVWQHLQPLLTCLEERSL